jgi:UDP-2-acetamido-3-amino-2,3-dideoxy-glucuronate N-acetyltransferase
MAVETEKNYFVHESSYVDEPCTIGKGTKIWHFSHVMKDSVIGEGCNLGQNVVISPGVTLGNNVKIQNNVSVYTGVILEDDVFCGPSCVFTNVTTPRSHVRRNDPAKDYAKTLVKRGASIGANATIVCGNTLGEYSFVGAGSVVTKDVPPYAMVYGNPARIKGWACECGIKLSFGNDRATCVECGKTYQQTGSQSVVRM